METVGAATKRKLPRRGLRLILVVLIAVTAVSTRLAERP
jgi:hypothetical protein